MVEQCLVLKLVSPCTEQDMVVAATGLAKCRTSALVVSWVEAR